MRKLGEGLLVLLVAAAIAWAGDPWKGKPYQTWNREDALKVINDSPWARVTQVSVSWKPAALAPGMPDAGGGMGGAGGGGGGAAKPGGGYGGGGGRMGGAGGAGAATPAGGGYGGAGGSEMPTAAEASFEARWMSSQVIREALVRLQVLSGAAQEAQAESYLAQEPPGYQLWLLGTDFTPFENLEEKALKEDVYLEMKKTHERVPAASVEIQRGQNQKFAGLIYTFPKTLGNGQPAIPANEKQVEFICRAGPKVTLRFTFDLTKMVDQKGRDL